MIKKNIYNSSGKIIGELLLDSDLLHINNYKKPELTIPKVVIGESLFSRIPNEKLFVELYDVYTLSIGEIAAIFDVHYHIANIWYKQSNTKSSLKAGRRNSSYGQKQSASRKDKISHAHRGRKVYNNGEHEKFLRSNDVVPEGYQLGRLPFTSEHIEKIHTAILDMQSKGIMKKGKEAAQLGWKNGKFVNVNFRRGIGGWITSNKIQKRFFFRSLLELKFILLLEKNPDVSNYAYEPFAILCDNGQTYTPDFLVNNQYVYELKSYKFIYKQGGKIQSEFEYKCQQAQKYCTKNNYTYQVIYDKDIHFNTERFKHELMESGDIDKFEIKFAQPERFWSKK